MGTFKPASVQVSDALLSFMARVQWQSQTLTCFFRMKCTQLEEHAASLAKLAAACPETLGSG